MSLLNDALKRAQRAQQPRQSSSPDQPRLQPAKEKPAPQRFGVWWVVGIVLTVAACSTAAFWWRAAKPASPVVEGYAQPMPVAGNALRPAVDPAPVQRVTAPAPAPSFTGGVASGSSQPGPTPVAQVPAPASLPVQVRVEPSASVRANPAVIQELQPPGPTQSNPVAAAGTAPEFRLEAIHFRLKKPSASINGKVVFVGQDLEGARIIAIARESVQLEFQGRRMTLRRSDKAPVQPAARKTP